MAFVILGGLVTSTLLNLLVIPSLFARRGDVTAADKDGRVDDAWVQNCSDEDAVG